METKYSIKDLENLTGIKAHTLRIWEKRYQILEPKRTETNIRYYNNDDLKKILNINLLNKGGFKISKIASLKDDEIKTKANNLLKDKNSSESKEINALTQSIIKLDTSEIEKILEKEYQEKGILRLYKETITPLLIRMGELWQLSTLNISHEHLFSNTLRKFIIVKTDEVKAEKQLNKSVLIFLTKGEHHEIPILFYNYFLKSFGWDSIYLGANVPTEDLRLAIIQKNPDLVFTSMIINVTGDRFHRNLDSILEIIPEKKLCLSTTKPIKNKDELYPRLNSINSYDDFVKLFKI
ncbi:MerR family transcriptional regulator [Crocinitomicaceae bacterium]|jgi:DNA-binding transcriptional MerR regulator|nr:MerR family transcriptional regulator [Crocinitomicaceae bacterium]MDC1195763.1 MerR family transcriptional regulator [Crocinitomicaceae bacterium]|tara:strand:+ start:179 stop:1060 length:882 start_codon:yes stop_codon:yes gene_type:complete